LVDHTLAAYDITGDKSFGVEVSKRGARLDFIELRSIGFSAELLKASVVKKKENSIFHTPQCGR